MWDESFIAKKRTEFLDEDTKTKLLEALEGQYGIDLLEEGNEDDPYIRGFSIQRTAKYNPHYGDSRTCQCGHPYHRHFDSYEDYDAVGCKYCQCATFVEKKEA